MRNTLRRGPLKITSNKLPPEFGNMMTNPSKKNK